MAAGPLSFAFKKDGQPAARIVPSTCCCRVLSCSSLPALIAFVCLCRHVCAGSSPSCCYRLSKACTQAPCSVRLDPLFLFDASSSPSLLIRLPTHVLVVAADRTSLPLINEFAHVLSPPTHLRQSHPSSLPARSRSACACCPAATPLLAPRLSMRSLAPRWTYGSSACRATVPPLLFPSAVSVDLACFQRHPPSLLSLAASRCSPVVLCFCGRRKSEKYED